MDDAGDMRFWIAILDQSYWILGSVLGTIIGGVLPLNSRNGATRVAKVQTAATAIIAIA